MPEYYVSAGFRTMKKGDLYILAGNVAKCTASDPRFSDAPVSPQKLAADNEQFGTALQAALDGGKSALAARDSAWEIVIQDLQQLATYVNIKANGDPEVITAAGFEAATQAAPLPQSVSAATIRKILRGPNSGQLLVFIQAVLGAVSYKLHYAASHQGIPGPWTEINVMKVKSAILISGLTPGQTYVFQACALGRDGNFGDWGGFVSIICG